MLSLTSWVIPLLLCGIVLLAFTLYNNKVVFPSHLFVIFFIYLFFISMVSIVRGSVPPFIDNQIFNCAIIVIVCTLFGDRTWEEWEALLAKASLAFLIAIDIEIAMNVSEIIRLLNTLGHPEIDSIFGSGNIGAGLFAMVGFFAFRKQFLWGSLFFVNSVAFSVLFKSRAGLMGNAILACWILFAKIKTGKGKLRIVAGLTAIAALFAFAFYKGWFSSVSQRLLLSMIGTDNFNAADGGVAGRLVMWRYFLPALMKNPFGVGAGGAVRVVNELAGINNTISNIHNIYMQFFLDYGVIFGTIFLFFAIRFCVKGFKNYQSPLYGAIVAYFFMGLVQFTSVESYFYVLLGIHFALSRQKTRAPLLNGDDLSPRTKQRENWRIE
jgi:hypothetical protein